MLPRKVLLTLVALLVAIGLPVVALAGGWSTVTLDSPPGEIAAGREITIGFTVLQHGKTPLADQQPKILLSNPAAGATEIVVGRPEGVPGHYTARFTLEQPGTWEWAIDVFEGPHPMAALTVVAAPASAPAPAPAATAPIGQAYPAEWFAIAGGAALALVLVFALATGLRRRGQPGQVVR